MSILRYLIVGFQSKTNSVLFIKLIKMTFSLSSFICIIVDSFKSSSEAIFDIVWSRASPLSIDLEEIANDSKSLTSLSSLSNSGFLLFFLFKVNCFHLIPISLDTTCGLSDHGFITLRTNLRQLHFNTHQPSRKVRPSH